MEGVDEAPRPAARASHARHGGLRGVLQIPSLLQRSIGRAHDHDCFNLAQSAAYSAIVALFPALIVSAAVLALLPEAAPLKLAIGAFFDEVLPGDVSPLLTTA